MSLAARLARKVISQELCSLCRSRSVPINGVRHKSLPSSCNTQTEILDKDSKKEEPECESQSSVYGVYEERLKYSSLLEEQEEDDPFAGLNLERGVMGVFDIEDLVEVLQRENALDLFVAKVPDEIKYVNYMCVVSGKSQRHMRAIAQFVKRVYKQKKHLDDEFVRVEGENSKDWIAMDLGNIALQIFSPSARTLYDLDSLWAVGPQYDKEYNKQEPVSEMLESHSLYLSELQPAK